jgi:hypothetical protein
VRDIPLVRRWSLVRPRRVVAAAVLIAERDASAVGAMLAVCLDFPTVSGCIAIGPFKHANCMQNVHQIINISWQQQS